MFKIKDDNKLYFFGEMFTRLYTEIANQDALKNKCVDFENYPYELQDFIKLIYPNENITYKNFYKDDNKKIFKVKNDEKRVLVAFSGGKDSVAVVLKLLKMKYKPILFFVKGVNRQYLNEYKSVETLAKKLNCELVVHEARFLGSMFYAEVPIKNQYILSLMLDYGINNNIDNYCMGNCSEDSFEQANRHFNWSDSMEMFNEFEKFVKIYFPQYKQITLIKGEYESYKEIFDSKKEYLFDDISSCILAYRFQNSVKKKNEQKYGIKLGKYDCGSCVKCCMDYVYFCEYNVVKKNEDYYNHCINKLKEKVFEVYGFKGNKLTKYELFDLYKIKKA